MPMKVATDLDEVGVCLIECLMDALTQPILLLKGPHGRGPQPQGYEGQHPGIKQRNRSQHIKAWFDRSKQL